LNLKPQQVIESIKLPSNGLSPGPGEVGQGGLKFLHVWRHSEKIRTPNQNIFFRVQNCKPAVAGVTFSDSNSAPVPKFLNPGPDQGPAIFLIWESDSCSDSG